MESHHVDGTISEDSIVVLPKDLTVAVGASQLAIHAEQDAELLVAGVVNKVDVSKQTLEAENPPPNASLFDEIMEFSKFDLLRRLGEGRCGPVFEARLKASSTTMNFTEPPKTYAIKAFNILDSSLNKRFKKERNLYKDLAHLQGQYLLPVLCDMVIAGTVIGILMEIGQPIESADGGDYDEFEDWSMEDKNQAMTAVKALLAEGFYQTDLEAKNFLKYNGKVMMIDLESFEEIDKHERKKYLKKARKIIFE